MLESCFDACIDLQQSLSAEGDGTEGKILATNRRPSGGGGGGSRHERRLSIPILSVLAKIAFAFCPRSQFSAAEAADHSRV